MSEKVDPCGLAKDALFAAACELPLDACRELAQSIAEWAAVQSQNTEKDLDQLGTADARHIAAMQAAAETLGHVPNSSEYEKEYKRRRKLGDSAWPSTSSHVKRFGSWNSALAVAGLAPEIPISALERSKRRRLRSVHRYDDAVFERCLRSCWEACGRRRPLIRDYAAWRKDQLGNRSPRRRPASEIPHHHSFSRRYGSWPKALAAAGIGN